MGRAGVFQTSGCGFEPRCPLKAVAIVLDFVMGEHINPKDFSWQPK